MTKLELWNELPHSVQLNLANKYGIKWFGTTEAQLEFELQNKLPKDLLVETTKDEEKVVQNAKSEPTVSPKKVIKKKTIKKINK